MKRHIALAWLLLVSVFMVIPFTVFLNTSVRSQDATRTNAPGAAPNQETPTTIFTVMNNNDMGAGSLREAIDMANALAGFDMIIFNPGIGTINVGDMCGMGLPVITERVTIDGGSPRVELNGFSAGGSANGLEIAATATLVTVRGLVINRFALSGISIQGDNAIVDGNFIGTDAAGMSALPNGGAGVLVVGPNNTIGGTDSAASNVISGNGGFGIEISGALATGNTVQGNFIGTAANGTSPLGNTGGGVRTLGSASFNSIGGTILGASNTIAFNNGSGVNISSGVNNGILRNSIFSNTGLGINLSDDPVTPNDACDVDAGANNLQNFPVLTSATSNGVSTTIIGSLNAVAIGAFRIEFFSNNNCDPSGFGQGAIFIGATTIMTDALCVGPINVVLPVAVTPGHVITATATSVADDTSEFSQCVPVVGVGSVSDLQITSVDSPDPVLTGANINYSIVVTNNGPDADTGVTLTDVLPFGTTFVSLISPGSCTTPPVGSGGTVNCSLGPLASGGSVALTLVVNVNAEPGATITNVVTVVGMSSDTTPGNNTATTDTAVISGSCTLTCPSDIVVYTSATSTSCGSVVTFAPTAPGCSAVTCAPPSGSLFAVGNTVVSCTAAGGPSCSFNLTVVDETPPSITCSAGVTAILPAGQLSAVVNYPAATASDNCTATSVVCAPPSGSTFPPGSTLITCTARDTFENASRCFFFVTVFDAEPPVIRCPANVSSALPAGQTSTVVNYPAPTVTDNLPGVTVLCVPPSGSSFPAGSTTVTCTATDTGGNKASCSFTVGVGAAQVKVTIPGNRAALEFAADPTRKPRKPKNNPCSFFTVENIGFSPLILTLDSISRTGANVDNGRITDPSDTRFFSLSRVNSDQSLTPLEIGAVLTLQPGQVQSICAKFDALIPALAGKTTGLAAANVLPDLVTSRIVFRQNAGANIAIPISASVSTGVVLVNLSNPRALPEVLFARSSNDITVSFAVFDSNLDVNRAKYEFLDNSGQVIAGPFEIDLTASISSANLVRGQSFSVEQRFTGASSNPEITSVRLTVSDGETSASTPSTASAVSISSAGLRLMNRTRGVTFYPPVVSLR